MEGDEVIIKERDGGCFSCLRSLLEGDGKVDEEACPRCRSEAIGWERVIRQWRLTQIVTIIFFYS